MNEDESAVADGETQDSLVSLTPNVKKNARMKMKTKLNAMPQMGMRCY
jgi:hypothetical protein